MARKPIRRKRGLRSRLRRAFRPAVQREDRLIKGKSRSPKKPRRSYFENKRRAIKRRRKVVGIRGKAAMRSAVLRRKGYRR